MYIITYCLSFPCLVTEHFYTLLLMNSPQKCWEHQEHLFTLARNVTSVVLTILTKSITIRDLEGPHREEEKGPFSHPVS